MASKDPTGATGGDLGFNTRDGLTPEIGAVAFALPPGQVAVYPVRSAGAWFIVKVDERRRGAVPGFASVRERLFQGLLRDGVPAATTTAMTGLTVREYNLSGKEIEQESSGGR